MYSVKDQEDFTPFYGLLESEKEEKGNRYTALRSKDVEGRGGLSVCMSHSSTCNMKTITAISFSETLMKYFSLIFGRVIKISLKKYFCQKYNRTMFMSP